MKKKYYLFVLLLSASFSLFAQSYSEEDKNKTIFGLKGGLNQSYLNTSSNNDYSGLELYGGFFAETRLSKRWSFQNELLYSFTDDISFLEIPLLLKYHVNDKWSFTAGPKLDIVASKSIDGATYNPLNISLEIGAQYDINKRLFIEARYSFGLSNKILIDNNFDNFSRNVLRFGVGFKF